MLHIVGMTLVVCFAIVGFSVVLGVAISAILFRGRM